MWNGQLDLMNRIKPISRLTDGPVNILVVAAMDIIVKNKQFRLVSGDIMK